MSKYSLYLKRGFAHASSFMLNVLVFSKEAVVV